MFITKILDLLKKFFEVEGELKVGLNELFKINNQWYNES